MDQSTWPLWPFYSEKKPDLLQAIGETPPLRRIRDTGMNCGCEYTDFPRFSHLLPYSRFDHSLGVALILWHFTHDRHQAVAGLLHDVATPAFAHTVDFLKGDHMMQEATEAGLETLLANSEELLMLLRREGITLQEAADFHAWPLADCPAPGLCADRLEYTLSNMVNYGFADRDTALALYADLTVHENEKDIPELCFQHREEAERFAFLSLRCSEVYVADEDRYAMQRLADLLADAIHRGVMAESLLWTSEATVIQALQHDSVSAAAWQAYRSLSRMERSDKPDDRDGWLRIHAKKRYIDPIAAGAGRVTSWSPAYSEALQAFLTASQDSWLRGC